MKTRIYEASFGQRYAIVEDKYSCTVLRKLPDSEYWAYYQERKNDLCVDDAYTRWLPIYRAWLPEDAERYLREIGVDCAAREVAPCGNDEGRFTVTGRNAKAFSWI